MSDNKKNNPKTELTDETLDKVAGGVNRPQKEYPCKGGCGKMLRSSGQYCDSCLKKLHDQGVYPPL